ncbi:sulfatase-like hydrolase/transferase [Candidatus Bathyarchaeota archaeon]|nr:sulfatase-like hydrolase/transferase [Candidatus Bathyarchaeota archaeon]
MSNGTKYNFIIIVSDTLRRDFLSCYNDQPDSMLGKHVDTRFIEDFSKKSVVFDRAYSGSFPTVPHRRDIFTGCFTATYTGWAPMTQFEPLLHVMLGQQGYTSKMIIDCPHLIKDGFHFDRGFDGWDWIRGQEGDRWKTTPRQPSFACEPSRTRSPERQQACHMRWRSRWNGEEDTFPARTANTACTWLEKNYKEGPFYLYIDFFDPHEPWDPPEWYIDMYDPGYEGQEIQYPCYSKIEGYMNQEELKHSRACYAGEVTLVDRWIGRIVQKVEDLGLLETTVVLLTADHGFLIGEHGFIGKSLINYSGTMRYLPLFEEINHVPFIVYHPDATPGRRQAMVQPPDIFPTFLDIEGKVTLPSDGESFKDILLGERDHHRNFTMSFPYLKGSGIPITIVKDGWAAFVFSSDSPKNELIDKAVDGYEKKLEPWENAGQDQLYNLNQDPRQQRDIAGDHPDLLKEFRETVVQFLERLDTEEDLIAGWRDKS